MLGICLLLQVCIKEKMFGLPATTNWAESLMTSSWRETHLLGFELHSGSGSRYKTLNNNCKLNEIQMASDNSIHGQATAGEGKWKAEKQHKQRKLSSIKTIIVQILSGMNEIGPRCICNLCTLLSTSSLRPSQAQQDNNFKLLYLCRY